MPALPADPAPIVVTASRTPERASTSAASVTVIDQVVIDRIDAPLADTYLRLSPSVAVNRSGPAGSLTEVRIRGAEANHTLLFMDGIKLNDPASGDTPRFELLNADLASRIEVVRGPQSALWGSDAIGGVVAINGLDDPTGARASAEAGSFGERRASLSGGLSDNGATLAAGVGFQRADGIDSFGSPGGDLDGYSNLSARVRGTVEVGNITLGATGLALTGDSKFDGYDPLTFAHTDTSDESRNRLFAARSWAKFGTGGSDWAGEISLAYVSSRNRNLLDKVEINRTAGTRRTLGAQVERRLSTGALDHRFIVAIEDERETFHARDVIYGGFSNQDRSRSRRAVVGEWRGSYRGVDVDLAVRHDAFNGFADATTWRAGLVAPVKGGFSLKASYATGIAAPTFFDLYGFFPGNFVGNQALKPEQSKGFEIGASFTAASLSADVTYFHQRLSDEIVDVFDPVTFLSTTTNSDRESRRSGVESQLRWTVSNALRLGASAAYLDAREPASAGPALVREARRPKWTGALSADGEAGSLTYGAALAYVGKHQDRRDSYPYDVVQLGAYWLADARIGFSAGHGVEVFVRGSNLLNQHYEDSFGYRTEPHGIFAGVKWARR